MNTITGVINWLSSISLAVAFIQYGLAELPTTLGYRGDQQLPYLV